MRYADYYDCDICNGKSVGMSLFIQGCPFHCQGCFNPETWNFNSGKEWTKEVEDKFVKLAGRDYIKRISFLGGSPLCDENIKDVSLLIQRLKLEYPDKKIWVYTGYNWEDIINPKNKDLTMSQLYRQEILSFIDILVDGQFEYNKKDLTLAFRGSTNQRIINVSKSLASGHIIQFGEDN